MLTPSEPSTAELPYKDRSVVVIERDMGFVEVATRVTVLHQGKTLSEGSMERVQNDPKVIEVYLGRGRTIMLDVTDLRYSLWGTEVLHGLDLRFKPGEIIAIMGRNGMGKTTLMKTLMGIVPEKSVRSRWAMIR